ncbi:uncharacterized protein METZ01_LOCUS214000 [marine metagenome]|uniref:Uncharacterized protein n=1 Tax=marine metagenome TaxID=408172 RepID=A0A382FDJ0_9ZZZZ
MFVQLVPSFIMRTLPVCSAQGGSESLHPHNNANRKIKTCQGNNFNVSSALVIKLKVVEGV